MMAECMLKKTKQQSQFMGVLTRSKTLALQKERGEFLQLGSRSFKKQRELLKGKGKKGIGRKRKVQKRVEVEKGGVKLEEGLEDKGEGKDDLERGSLVGGVVINSIGGAPLAIGGGGGGDSVISCGVDAMITGGGGVAGNGGHGGKGAEIGGDFMLGGKVLKTGSTDRLTRESTPEHLIIRSDCIRTPCSSTKGAKAVADEMPQSQTEVGGNSHHHKKLTTDFLLQENSNYGPSMEKYNFDFENEKPLPGRFEWEKVQP